VTFENSFATGSPARRPAKAFLARPWRPYSRVVYIDCEMGAQIRPEGWNNWNRIAANEKTAWFAEYGSSGPGANPTARMKWAHELTPGEVKQFLPNVFLRGDDNWQPERTP
jgi:pectinesterase